MAYVIKWNGKVTGICVPDKKVSISYFREFEPSATPIDNFEFIEIVERVSEYKKVRTISGIRSDPRIEELIIDFDGKGVHMVSCKEGWLFEHERTVDIGSIKELCDSINFCLEKQDI